MGFGTIQRSRSRYASITRWSCSLPSRPHKTFLPSRIVRMSLSNFCTASQGLPARMVFGALQLSLVALTLWRGASPISLSSTVPTPSMNLGQLASTPSLLFTFTPGANSRKRQSRGDIVPGFLPGQGGHPDWVETICTCILFMVRVYLARPPVHPPVKFLTM